jgi:hypothetical protein
MTNVMTPVTWRCVHVERGELPRTSTIAVTHLQDSGIDRHGPVTLEACALCAGYFVGIMCDLRLRSAVGR